MNRQLPNPLPLCRHGNRVGNSALCPDCEKQAFAIAATQVDPKLTPLTTIEHSGFSRPWHK